MYISNLFSVKLRRPSVNIFLKIKEIHSQTLQRIKLLIFDIFIIQTKRQAVLHSGMSTHVTKAIKIMDTKVHVLLKPIK